jgi:uroporphyrinogen decarboxylase
LNVPFENPQPDAREFKEVILGKAPKRAHFTELFLDIVVVKRILEEYLDETWTEPSLADPASITAFLSNMVHVWHRMGYDYYWTGGLTGSIFKGKYRPGKDTSAYSAGDRIWMEESEGMITNWEEYEAYPWPEADSVSLMPYEYISKILPEGMGILMCFGMGVIECVMNIIVGYVPLSYMLHESPDLAKAIFDRVGQTIYDLHKRVIGLPGMIGFFQGDDMGFKTGTLISPDHLREYVLPWHKKLADLAHENDLLYCLHSCGNLEEIYDDLIDDVGIDAKHSFEEKILPVTDFQKRYGSRVGTLGGVDINNLCTYSTEDLRRYAESIIDECMSKGGYAFGSGNSIANYIPLENYMTMMDVGARWRP